MIRPLTCAVCRKELPSAADPEGRWLPFCSERCRNVDLLRWSKGEYAIVEPLSPDSDELRGPMEDPYAD